MELKNVARIGDKRDCGAVIINPGQTSVFAGEGRLVAVLNALDSHGGLALCTQRNVFAELQPIIRIFDVNGVCAWAWPKHYARPLVTGDLNIYA